MTWLDRTQKIIQLISPDGDVYDALWTGDERTLSKKLGVFEIPDRAGAIVQDLEVGAFRYPITIYFEGTDHDITAQAFMVSCGQKGDWIVIHPTKGQLILQLVTVTEGISPIENGNITRISTEWIEPAEEQEAETTPEISQGIKGSIEQANETMTEQFSNVVKQVKSIQTSVIAATVDQVVGFVEKNLAPIYETVGAVASRMQSIKKGIDSTILGEIIDTDVLSAQIQNLIQIPAQVKNVTGKVTAYGNLIQDIVDTGAAVKATIEERNIVAVKELALVSCISSLAGSSTTADIKTKAQSIVLIETNAAAFKTVTDFLDESQEVFQT